MKVLLLWEAGAVVQYFSDSEASKAATRLHGKPFKGDRLDVHLVTPEEWTEVSSFLSQCQCATGEDNERFGLI